MSASGWEATVRQAPPNIARSTSFARLSGNTVFAALAVLGFANGSVSRVAEAIANDGWQLAILNTFEISAIVWAAFLLCPVLLRAAPYRAMTRTDQALAVLALLLILSPAGPLSWVALTLLALHMIRDQAAPANAPRSAKQRAGWILLATTGTMFWGRVLLQIASGPVLRADAVLVGHLFGLEQAGNTVSFADGDGFVWIAPACSSLSNISLAILCWVLLTQLRGLRWSPRHILWCLMACVSVAAINVVRVGLMLEFHDHFDVIHGPVGAAIAAWVTLIVIVLICHAGTRQPRTAYPK